MRFITLALVGLIFAGSGAEAARHDVPAGFSRIGDALAAAASGDSVVVASGTYSPSVNGEGFPLTLATSGVTLLGAGSDLCTIDAESTGAVIQVTAATGRVSGFTLTGGSGSTGGGLRVLAGAVEIDRNVIRDNAVLHLGSGMYITGGASPWVHHNVFWENVDADLADPGDPHGIQTQGAAGLIEHNLIGRGDSNGLLIAADDVPVVRNNIFYQNGIEGVRGRGICSFGGAGLVIAHNLFFDNAVAPLLLSTNPGFANFTSQEANDLSPSDGIYGNVDGDPLFLDPDLGDFSLAPGSPAIDAGDPASPPDPDGTTADIGPRYHDQGLTGIPGPGPALTPLPAFPNPFRATLELAPPPGVGPTRLEVLDVQGRRVRTLWTGDGADAPARLIWDGRDAREVRVAPGVYFVRLADAAGARLQRVVFLP